MKKIRTAHIDQYRPRSGGEHRNVALVALLMVLGVCLGLGAVGFFVYQGMVHSDFFQITEINIDGCRRVSKSKVLALSGVNIHSNLLGLNVDDVRKRLEGQAWIDKAMIDRQWPNRLEIVIKERKPEALINLASGLHFVDRNGVVIAPALPPEDIDFPVISGLKVKPEPGTVSHQALLAAIKFVGYAGGNPILPRQNISEVVVKADGDLVLLLVDRPFPIYLGKERLRTKYYHLSKVLHWLYNHKKFETTGEIQMDYRKDKVLVIASAAG